TLEEGMHSTEYTLAEARVIYELATRDAPKAKEIADALAMDQGYLSRLLTKLANAGLIQRKVSKHDNRAADLILTRKGRAAFARLNGGSDTQARTILAGLSPFNRTQLLRSMRTIETVLAKTDTSGAPYVLRPHRIGDMGWIVHREGLAYAEE